MYVMATPESQTWPAQHWPMVEFEVTIPGQFCQKDIPEWTTDENIAQPLEGSTVESVAETTRVCGEWGHTTRKALLAGDFRQV